MLGFEDAFMETNKRNAKLILGFLALGVTLVVGAAFYQGGHPSSDKAASLEAAPTTGSPALGAQGVRPSKLTQAFRAMGITPSADPH